jgi:N-carbamoylputrescine amidase
VAAVQLESKNGCIEANLQHAIHLIDLAAQKEAKLILLPEFMPTGYIWNASVWNSAEPQEGATVNWLKENSRRLGVWLGTSFLEAEEKDFFNTFVLTTPDGKEAGRVRKQTPAGFEAYFFRGSIGPHVIETELGKIGVGICYENALSYIPNMMYKHSVDLLLMPLSAPTPSCNFFFRRKQVEYYHKEIKEVPLHAALTLGIPVIMANKSGRWQSPTPALRFWKQDSSFPGLSTIIDSDGTIKAQLGDEEAVIVDDVILDPARKSEEPPTCYGRWAWEGHWVRNSIQITETLGRLNYTLNSVRKKRAREISASDDRIEK